MAPRRVVNDSDDDDSAFSPDVSPEKESSNGTGSSRETGLTVIQPSGGIIGTSSTDPIFFQAIYEEQRASFMTPIDLNSRDTIPILEDHIINQRMSSSPATGRSFTRNLSIETSSLTSISEPSTSNRRMKSTKSAVASEGLPQIMIPAESKVIMAKATAPVEINPSPSKDMWEFPGSSSGPDLASTKVKSRNALKSNEAMKRTKTMSAMSSKPAESKQSVRSLDDTDVPVNRKRSSRSHGDEDLQPILPNAKRHKRKISVNAEILSRIDGVSDTSSVRRNKPMSSIILTQRQMMPSDSLDLANLTTPHTTVLVPRSATQEDQVCIEFPTLNACDQADLMATSGDSVVKQTYSSDKGSLKSGDRATSLMVVPNMLTEKQKMDYNIVTFSSSNSGPQSSMPDLFQLVNSEQPAKYLTKTTTQPVASTPPKYHLMGDMGPHVLPDTELPTPNWKIERLKAETVVVAQSLTVSISGVKTTTPTRRSKSMTQKNKQQSRELSTDELSLDFPESVELILSNSARRVKERKATEGHVASDRVLGAAEDEVHMQRSQSQSSVRRSKSMTAHFTDANIRGDRNSPRRGRPRKMKAISVTGPPLNSVEALPDETSEPRDVRTEYVTYQDEHSAKVMENNVNDALASPLTEVDTTSAFQEQPLQPKKRGRKKGAAKTATPQNSPPSLPPQVCDAPQALQERDPNSQPPEPSTPSWNRPADSTFTKTPPVASNDPHQAKTPVRATRKGSEQHSPLPSGKVPYRVGLSRKTRIAPLLKIIRKDG